MKRGYSFLLSIFMFILFTNVVEANTVNTGFKTDQLPNEEKNMFIANINVLSIDEDPVKKPITCIDVNSNRLIAIGQNTSDRKIICIYSNEGVFQYGYTFNCNGDFGVEWDEENLNIYFVRSSVIVSVTPRGEVLDVFEVPNTIENNSYVNHYIRSTRKTIGDTEYVVGNNLGILNLFAPSYSQIVAKDSAGAESVIYDVGSMQLSNMIVTIGIICMFVSVAIAAIAWKFIKLRRGH